MIIHCRTRDRSVTLTLTDVLVAPAIPINVVSVAKLCQQNFVTVVFTDEYASFCRCEEISAPNISSPRIVNEEFFSVHTSIPTSVTPDKQTVVKDVSDRSSPPRKCRATYFTSPFFSVPRNADNLYSFKLSLVFSNNIPLSYSSMYFLEESIPEGMGQAYILVTNLPEVQRSTTQLNQRQQEGESRIIDQQDQQISPEYRTKSGGSKSAPFTKTVVPQKTVTSQDLVSLWHKRLGHASLKVVRHFLSLFQPNIKLTGVPTIEFCDVCVRTKLTHKAYDQVRTIPTRPAEVIMADIIGPISPTTTPNGYKFILTMLDCYSKFARTFLLKRKSETAQYIKVFFLYGPSTVPEPRTNTLFLDG